MYSSIRHLVFFPILISSLVTASAEEDSCNTPGRQRYDAYCYEQMKMMCDPRAGGANDANCIAYFEGRPPDYPDNPAYNNHDASQSSLDDGWENNSGRAFNPNNNNSGSQDLNSTGQFIGGVFKLFGEMQNNTSNIEDQNLGPIESGQNSSNQSGQSAQVAKLTQDIKDIKSKIASGKINTSKISIKKWKKIIIMFECQKKVLIKYGAMENLNDNGVSKFNKCSA